MTAPLPAKAASRNPRRGDGIRLGPAGSPHGQRGMSSRPSFDDRLTPRSPVLATR